VLRNLVLILTVPSAARWWQMYTVLGLGLFVSYRQSWYGQITRYRCMIVIFLWTRDVQFETAGTVSHRNYSQLDFAMSVHDGNPNEIQSSVVYVLLSTQTGNGIKYVTHQIFFGRLPDAAWSLSSLDMHSFCSVLYPLLFQLLLSGVVYNFVQFFDGSTHYFSCTFDFMCHWPLTLNPGYRTMF
jgi:hypothetical protein